MRNILSAFVILGATSFLFASPDYSLGLGYSRTYIQYYLPIPGASFNIKDTIVDEQVYNGYTVFTNNNSVYNEIGFARTASTPVSYWYERNDTIFAAGSLENVGVDSLVEIVFIPTTVPSRDSTVIENGTDSGKIKYHIYDSAFSVTTSNAVFNHCVKNTEVLKDTNGLLDTLSISYRAPSIGAVLYKTATGSTKFEIVSYNVDIGSMKIKNQDTHSKNANIQLQQQIISNSYSLLGQRLDLTNENMNSAGLIIAPKAQKFIFLK